MTIRGKIERCETRQREIEKKKKDGALEAAA